jgi:hypothetical protein
MKSINLGMSFFEMISVMSEGNQDATKILEKIANNDSVRATIQILKLDSLDIRGLKLCKFYNECCGQNMDKLFRTLEFIREGAYTQEEVDLNFQLPISLPFISDSVKDEDYRTEKESHHMTSLSEKWNEFVQAHRATLVPKLEEFKKENNVSEGLGF